MATVLSNLVGRTARPSPDCAHVWPWSWRFKPTDEERRTGRCELDRMGSYKVALFAERAKVVAVRADKDGVKITIENAAGEMGEVFASNVALVPKCYACPADAVGVRRWSAHDAEGNPGEDTKPACAEHETPPSTPRAS